MDKIETEKPVVENIARSIKHMFPTLVCEVKYDEFGTHHVREDRSSMEEVIQLHTRSQIDEPHWRIYPDAGISPNYLDIRSCFMEANIKSMTEGVPVKAVFVSDGRLFIGITSNSEMSSEEGSVSKEDLQKYADIVESVFQKEKARSLYSGQYL